MLDKKKRLLVIGLIGAMAFALAGCGADDGVSKSAGTKGITSANTEAELSAEEEADSFGGILDLAGSKTETDSGADGESGDEGSTSTGETTSAKQEDTDTVTGTAGDLSKSESATKSTNGSSSSASSNSVSGSNTSANSASMSSGAGTTADTGTSDSSSGSTSTETTSSPIDMGSYVISASGRIIPKANNTDTVTAPNNSSSSGKVSSVSTNSSSAKTTTHTHSYSASVTTAATCAETGVKTYTCSCGDSYTETIPATGNHTWQDVTEQVLVDGGTYTEDEVVGYEKSYKCECGQTWYSLDELEDHLFGNSYGCGRYSMFKSAIIETKTYENPDYYETVVTGQKCSVCGVTK